MNRRLITTVLLTGGTVAAVYLASTSDFPTGPAGMRAATCGVRISDECLVQYPALKRYETLRFPVMREVRVDGGLAFTLPQVLGDPDGIVRNCVEVVDWASCDLDTCATYPAVCAAWDAGQPVVRVRSASKYVIPDCRGPDGGWDDTSVVDCRRKGVGNDGGTAWWGCNVFPRSESVGTKCLDAPSGTVMAGERIEDSM